MMRSRFPDPTSLLPCYLFVGNRDAVIEHAYQLLLQTLCPVNGCHTCTHCILLKKNQHHALLWLKPEKYYTLDELAPIAQTAAFVLEPDSHFFFVIENADLLTPACANSLLKSLEEPPTGYHFILLAQRLDALLPTIKSRCVIHQLGSTLTQTHHPLFPFFIASTMPDPLAFMQELDTTNPTEPESMSLLDSLLEHFAQEYRQAIISSDTTTHGHTEHALTILKQAFNKPPMPGSSKLFWKNIFLKLYR
jgi:DNA polymerase-3 subunit delta'